MQTIIVFMRKVFYFTMIFLLILITISYSAPSVLEIAINGQTKECAYYWAGDEYIRYKLPSGWEIIHSGTYSGRSCHLSTMTPEQCCSQLGLKYLTGNIGYVPIDKIIFSPVGIIIIIVIIFIISKFIKRKG